MINKLICWWRGHKWWWLCSTSTSVPEADQLYRCHRCGLTKQLPYFNLAKAWRNMNVRSRQQLVDSISSTNEILSDLDNEIETALRKDKT